MELLLVRFLIHTSHVIHTLCLNDNCYTTEPLDYIMIEDASAESVCTSCSLLNTEWCRSFYGSISECQGVQEVHTYSSCVPLFVFVSRLRRVQRM